MAVKLHRPSEIPGDSMHTEVPCPAAIQPLVISGLVVTKDDLITLLRAYVPGLMDLEVVDDGERFVLTLGTIRESGASG